jgi:hypothetical protein
MASAVSWSSFGRALIERGKGIMEETLYTDTTPSSTAFKIARNNTTWTFWVTDGTNLWPNPKPRILQLTPRHTVMAVHKTIDPLTGEKHDTDKQPHRVFSFEGNETNKAQHELMLAAGAIARLVFQLDIPKPRGANEDTPDLHPRWAGEVVVGSGESPRTNEFVQCVAKCLQALITHTPGHRPCRFFDATKPDQRIPLAVMKTLDKDCAPCTLTMTTRDNPDFLARDFLGEDEWEKVEVEDLLPEE